MPTCSSGRRRVYVTSSCLALFIACVFHEPFSSAAETQTTAASTGQNEQSEPREPETEVTVVGTRESAGVSFKR